MGVKRKGLMLFHPPRELSERERIIEVLWVGLEEDLKRLAYGEFLGQEVPRIAQRAIHLITTMLGELRKPNRMGVL